MTITMGLNHDQFLLVEQESKTIEIRLNDEKRQKLQLADKIKLVDTTTNDVLTVQVTKLETFPDFATLFTKYSGTQVGSAPDDSQAKMVSDMYQIYSPKKEQQYGVMAITIKLI